MGRKQRAVTVLTVIILLAVGMGLLYVSVATDIPLSDAERLRAWVAGYGVLAPIVLMGIQVVQVVIAPLPNQVSAVAAGFLFGVVKGTLYTTIGTLIGSYVAFLLGRRVGRPLVVRMTAADRIEQFDVMIDRYGAVAFTVMFLIPAFPGDILCYVGGMSRMRPRTFLAVAFLGRGPKFLLYSVIGHRLAAGGVTATLPYVTPLIVLAAVTVWKRDRLEAVLDTVDSWGRRLYP